MEKALVDKQRWDKVQDDVSELYDLIEELEAEHKEFNDTIPEHPSVDELKSFDLKAETPSGGGG